MSVVTTISERIPARSVHDPLLPRPWGCPLGFFITGNRTYSLSIQMKGIQWDSWPDPDPAFQ